MDAMDYIIHDWETFTIKMYKKSYIYYSFTYLVQDFFHQQLLQKGYIYTYIHLRRPPLIKLEFNRFLEGGETTHLKT